jgi:hypothetical protein
MQKVNENQNSAVPGAETKPTPELSAAAPALYEALVKARDTFDDIATTLRLLRHGVAASACDIARDATNEALALATKSDTSEQKG